MPNIRVPADGEAMPSAQVPFITPQDGALAFACAALHRHRVALDALRQQAEAEVAEHALARQDMEALIARLIDGLDDLDGDPDLEPTMGYVVPGYVDEAEDVSEDEGAACEDEGNDGGDRELDPAEGGVADIEALGLVMDDVLGQRDAHFDGSGVTIARGQLATSGKAALRDPDQVYVLEPGIAALFPRSRNAVRVGNVWLPA